MKVTMIYEDQHPGVGAPIHRTIIVDEPGSGQIEDLVMIFKSFLMMMGYHQDTVNAWVDHKEDS